MARDAMSREYRLNVTSEINFSGSLGQHLAERESRSANDDDDLS